MQKFIPYSCQCIDSEDEKSVVEVLHSPFLTQGERIREFEALIAKKVEVPYVHGFTNATAALHCACLALGLQSGDYLWTSPNSFVSSSNCALFCGAKVDFVDIDKKTYNLDANLLELKLKKTPKKKLPKIVVAVHFAGQSCEMEDIYFLSQKYGFKVIEDASHAIGAKFRATFVGSCRFSDISVFSFHPVKIITTAEGGATTTKDTKIAKKLEMLSSHGITKNHKEFKRFHKKGSWLYEAQMLGFNYRLDELRAALGISQMRRLDEFVLRRNELAKRYDKLLADLPLKTPFVAAHNFSSFHLYPIQVCKSAKVSRLALFEGLLQKNIGVQVHYIPIHTQPIYAKMGFKEGDFPNAEKYYSRAISLPLFPSMTEQQQDYVVDSIKELLG